MPRFDEVMESRKVPGTHFGYTGTRLADLTGATEYTLCTIVLDESGSTAGFASDMEKCISEIVKACRYSPRADNLMLRLVAFGTNYREIHGFKLLQSCNPDDYIGCYGSGGSTALFDSSCDAIEATKDYAKSLADNEYLCNACVFVLTDGDDNASKFSAIQVKEALAKCVSSEALESLVSVLIGVNITDPVIKKFLENFHKTAEFTQFVELKDASEKTLAKLAAFVSKSISSQSQALGTGGPSQSLTF
jgi:uncharacterized protein YegL